MARVGRDAAAFTLGGALTGGGILAYFAALGIIPEMLIVAQSTSAYNAQYSDWGAFFSQIGGYFTFAGGIGGCYSCSWARRRCWG